VITVSAATIATQAEMRRVSSFCCRASSFCWMLICARFAVKMSAMVAFAPRSRAALSCSRLDLGSAPSAGGAKASGRRGSEESARE
jgi:hypothetical protein